MACYYLKNKSLVKTPLKTKLVLLKKLVDMLLLPYNDRWVYMCVCV